MYYQYLKYLNHHKSNSSLNFGQDGRNYYVYRITNIQTSKHYYGSRVTKIEPIDDIGIIYFSSSYDDSFISEQHKFPNNFKYKIIKIFNNSGDAIILESYLHSTFQVSLNSKFINRCMATPRGFTITGNSYAARKGVHTRNTTIDPNTGFSITKTAAMKSSITKNKIDPITGLTNAQLAGPKISETINKIDIDTGLSIARSSALKSSNTMKKLDENGLSIYQKNGLKHSTRLKIVDSITRLTLIESISIKRDNTMKKLDENGLSIYQKNGLKCSGVFSAKFKGYFVILDIQYETSDMASKSLGNISASCIRKWCQYSSNLITKSTYSKSTYLKELYGLDIIGKSFKDIGFYFKPYSSIPPNGFVKISNITRSG